MKYTWEESDIKCGKFVYAHTDKEKDILNFTRIYQIGYVGGSSTKDEDGSGVALISFADGMVSENYSKSELVAILNKENMIPLNIAPNFSKPV